MNADTTTIPIRTAEHALALGFSTSTASTAFAHDRLWAQPEVISRRCPSFHLGSDRISLTLRGPRTQMASHQALADEQVLLAQEEFAQVGQPSPLAHQLQAESAELAALTGSRVSNLDQLLALPWVVTRLARRLEAAGGVSFRVAAPALVACNAAASQIASWNVDLVQSRPAAPLAPMRSGAQARSPHGHIVRAASALRAAAWAHAADFDLPGTSMRLASRELGAQLA